MNWLRRYQVSLYLRNSIWILPLISIGAGLITAAILDRLDRAIGWKIEISAETARVVMGTIAASMFTLVVLVSSALLLAVQLASAQLTPRIISFVYRNTTMKRSLAVFVFTFTLSLSALVRIQDSAMLLTGYVVAYGFLINVILFLYFIEAIGKTLRPSSALQNVALLGRDVIRSVYPAQEDENHLEQLEPLGGLAGSPERVVLNTVDGTVLAFDLKGLVLLAERYDCAIQLVPQVGDYIAAGDPLFYIFESGRHPPEDILLESIAIGPERTMEQDPMFAFRIIVDIAAKALSPAVNDPTTAVLAIDQLQHLLRKVGTRYLGDGRETDGAGRLRLVYRTPDWDDFVHLAVTEIRQFGRESIQVMRRLRAMLESLIETLPDYRAQALRRELTLLEKTSQRSFADRDDQSLARKGDLQGMGGADDERENQPQPETVRHRAEAR